MGLGDEIMALGRAEKIFKETGTPVAICRAGGYARDHEAWHGNPAVDMFSQKKIIDGSSCRPYLKMWTGRQAIFNLEHKASAGRIHLTQDELSFAIARTPERFAVVAPYVKNGASKNKDWGAENWQAVIDGFPIPVLQLLQEKDEIVINGAVGVYTPHFRQAAAIISRAAVVLCNEGGNHHIAAGFGVPAVVVFGSFVPPSVTGYDIHTNFAVETEHGFCGNFDTCKECQKALALITPDMVKSAALKILGDSHA